MGLQRIGDRFPSRGDLGGLIQFNTLDSTPIFTGGAPAFTSAYTMGSAIIAQPPSQLVGRKWKLLSIAFRCTLAINGGFTPTYGRHGKVYSAVDLSGSLTPSGPLTASAASIPPWRELPQDNTLQATMWDPAADALPPDASTGLSATNTGQVATSVIQLPTPLPLHDNPISVGIWVERSLLGCPVAMPNFATMQGICVAFAAYTLNFDDGE